MDDSGQSSSSAYFGGACRHEHLPYLTSVTNADGEQLPVSWRVKSFDGDWQIIDVEFEGLWLVIEQRAQFQATLDANGGDVGALADSL